MADTKKLIEIIRAVSEKIKEEKDYLTDLDRPIGDSDHGINMARGFATVEEKLPAMEDKDAGTILKTVGMALVSTVGGSAGPLYGTAFMKAAGPVSGKQEIDLNDFIALLEAAVAGVKMRGGAKLGEATMVDAMEPSLEAVKAAAEAGKTAKEALADGVAAAWAGAEATKPMIATKGRASYVGERGIGHQDPGATSYAFMLETVAKALD